MILTIDSVAEKFTTFPLKAHIIMLARAGSDVHGTKQVTPDSIDDTDFFGVVVPPDRHVLGLGTWEHWVYPPDENGLDVVLYSVRKYVSLLLKCNPNVIGSLWLRDEDYLFTSPSFDQLRSNRAVFSSRDAYATFMGYANSQLKKMTSNAFQGYMGAKRKSLVEKHGFDTKNAAHLVRLLRMGVEFLQTGEMKVYREDREELMAIKRGEWSLWRVKEEADKLFEIARIVRDQSPLPEKPDFALAESILMRIHQDYLGAKGEE